MLTQFKLRGRFVVQHIRGGEILKTYTFKNGVVDEGINAILNIMFHAASQITAWYLGLINDADLVDLLATDTMAAHPNWVEDQSYTELTRPAWPEDAAASKAIANTTPVDFSINATRTISGVFLTSDNTKGGTTGTLWATGLFTEGDASVQSGDTLRVIYQISGAAA